MASYRGSIKTSDPRYREGFKIVMPQQSNKKKKASKSSTQIKQEDVNKVKQELTDSELETLKKRGLEVLEEQRKELIKGGSM